MPGRRAGMKKNNITFENEPDPERILQALSTIWKAKKEKETGAAVSVAASFAGGDEKTA
jgi:hypothetical protein